MNLSFLPQSACFVCACVCVCVRVRVCVYKYIMSICMCDMHACLCISFGLKKLIGTMYGKYNHPICVDNNTTILNASDGETTIGIQYESGRVVISTFNSYWCYLCTHSLSCKILWTKFLQFRSPLLECKTKLFVKTEQSKTMSCVCC